MPFMTQNSPNCPADLRALMAAQIANMDAWRVAAKAYNTAPSHETHTAARVATNVVKESQAALYAYEQTHGLYADFGYDEEDEHEHVSIIW